MTGSGKVLPLLVPGRNCIDIFEADEQGLFVDARDYYLAFASAARQAKRYILITGWQFDSEVRLVRGKDVKDTAASGSMLNFLNELCRENPELDIYILAWDYSTIFALEREWFQTWIFKWKTDERVHFRLDSNHAVMASHHEKFVVIDGHIAFVGGLDICEDRWDDRRHLADNPYRVDPDGRPYKPNHEIQAFVNGPAALKFAGMFFARWEDSGGGDIRIAQVSGPPVFHIKPTLEIRTKKVAISRTRARTVVPSGIREPLRQIRSLYIDAISSADEIIYIENQYFSSQAVYKALIERMEASGRPRLEIIMVFPRKPPSFVEELALGVAQARMFTSLRETAAKSGHALGIYCTSSPNPAGGPVPVQIHSKLLLVDDRFLTAGSANTTNRSMGLDSELNLSWEAESERDRPLMRSIRKIRLDLLKEHAGLRGLKARQLIHIKGLVGSLNALSEEGRIRLSHAPVEEYLSGSTWLKELNPEDLSIDPEMPIIEENIFELISNDKDGVFAQGITALNRWLDPEAGSVLSSGEGKEEKQKQPVKRHRGTARFSLLFKLLIAAGAIVLLLIAAAVIVVFFH